MLSLLLDILFNMILPYRTNISEDEICENMKVLKKNKWFQNILRNEKYRQFIIHDREIRNLIGKFNHEKLQKNLFHQKYERKLMAALNRKKIVYY